MHSRQARETLWVLLNFLPSGSGWWGGPNQPPEPWRWAPSPPLPTAGKDDDTGALGGTAPQSTDNTGDKLSHLTSWLSQSPLVSGHLYCGPNEMSGREAPLGGRSKPGGWRGGSGGASLSPIVADVASYLGRRGRCPVASLP